MQDTTSPMRQAMCAAIISAVYGADGARKQWLADLLHAEPFENMNDNRLVEVAYEAGVPEDRIGVIVAERSHEAHPIIATYMCPRCLDTHVVEVEPGRWGQCAMCTVPLVEYENHTEPAESKS